MILLFLFISLFIGINIKSFILLGIIEAALLLMFLYFRVSKKFSIISLGVILLGVGLSFISPRYEKEEYQSLVVEVKENYYIASSSFEKFYVYEKAHDKEIGDIITLVGKKKDLEFNKLESSFDFKQYLNNKGVYSEFVVSKSYEKFKNPLRIYSLKKKFLSNFDSDTSSLLASSLFGLSLEGETSSLFREYHFARLISNSGLFLDVFFSIFIFLFTILFKDKKLSSLFSIIILIFYSVFTFPRFVLIKYVVIKILRWINDYLLKKKFNYLEIISFTGIIFLLIDYHLAYQDSFLLSYFIPLFVYFINGSLRKFKNWQKRLIIIPLVMVLFIPFSISYYHELSPLSPLIQIIISPIYFIYIIIGLFSFIFIPLPSLLNGYTLFLKGIVNVSSIFCFKIHALEINAYGIFFFELIYILFIHFSLYGFRPMYRLCLLGLISFNSIYLLPIKPLIISSVSFINIGQGDATLIHYGTNTVLIDTGGLTYTDTAKDSIIPYLKKNQIYDIDLLVTTHDDFDHSGSVTSLIESFRVKRYVKDYQDFPISLGKKTFTNLNIYPSLWNEENDKSLVIYFELADSSFLIMGDAPKKIEKEIIKDHPNLDVDILKVGHHGSNTSSDESFIKALTPKEAIISCGKNNKFGHPHKDVVDVLNKYKVVIRRTDLEGTIQYNYLL